MGDAEAVIDEGGVKLAAEIFARLEFQLGRKRRAAEAYAGGVEAFVDAEKKKRQPAAVQFCRDDFETGKSFQHTRRDQGRKGSFDLMGINRLSDGALFRVGVPI